jgi:CarD family transcriptional regulator
VKIKQAGLVIEKAAVIAIKKTAEEEPVMQFKADDYVFHPVYGVGHIVRIEEKQFSEEEVDQYYEVVLSRSTIWIPVEAQETVGLRLVTAESDLDEYRDVLKAPPVPLDNSQPQQRHMELAGRLKQGSFQVMCEVVRDLTASSRQKPLGPTDKTTLQKTRDRLCQEWSTATGISITEVMNEINFLLTANQKEVLE